MDLQKEIADLISGLCGADETCDGKDCRECLPVLVIASQVLALPPIEAGLKAIDNGWNAKVDLEAELPEITKKKLKIKDHLARGSLLYTFKEDASLTRVDSSYLDGYSDGWEDCREKAQRDGFRQVVEVKDD